MLSLLFSFLKNSSFKFGTAQYFGERGESGDEEKGEKTVLSGLPEHKARRTWL